MARSKKTSPLTKPISEVPGISLPYASQLANGRREPNLELALRIFRHTSIVLGPLKGKPREQIEKLVEAHGPFDREGAT